MTVRLGGQTALITGAATGIEDYLEIKYLCMGGV